MKYSDLKVNYYEGKWTVTTKDGHDFASSNHSKDDAVVKFANLFKPAQRYELICDYMNYLQKECYNSTMLLSRIAVYGYANVSQDSIMTLLKKNNWKVNTLLEDTGDAEYAVKFRVSVLFGEEYEPDDPHYNGSFTII